MKRMVCASVEETRRLGARVASLLHAPAFVALYGDLGAGKTAFVGGMGAYLGAYDVCSPTFTIIHEYDVKPRLIHIDAYRLSNEDELFDIGFDDYMRESAVIAMEWSENVQAALPDERLEVTLSGCGDEPRTVEFVGLGARYEEAVERI